MKEEASTVKRRPQMEIRIAGCSPTWVVVAAAGINAGDKGATLIDAKPARV